MIVFWFQVWRFAHMRTVKTKTYFLLCDGCQVSWSTVACLARLYLQTSLEVLSRVAACPAEFLRRFVSIINLFHLCCNLESFMHGVLIKCWKVFFPNRTLPVFEHRSSKLCRDIASSCAYLIPFHHFSYCKLHWNCKIKFFRWMEQSFIAPVFLGVTLICYKSITNLLHWY